MINLFVIISFLLDDLSGRVLLQSLERNAWVDSFSLCERHAVPRAGLLSLVGKEVHRCDSDGLILIVINQWDTGPLAVDDALVHLLSELVVMSRMNLTRLVVLRASRVADSFLDGQGMFLSLLKVELL